MGRKSLSLLVAIFVTVCGVALASKLSVDLPAAQTVKLFDEVHASDPTLILEVVAPESVGDLSYVAYSRRSKAGAFGTDSAGVPKLPKCCVVNSDGEEVPQNGQNGEYACINHIGMLPVGIKDESILSGVIPSTQLAKGHSLDNLKIKKSSGHFQAVVLACKATNKKERVALTIGFKNYWGYLPYSIYPVLWILVVSLLLYLVYIIWYAVLLVRHWKELLTLQKMVMALLVVSFFEGLFVIAEYGYWNQAGWHSLFLVVLSQFLVAVTRVGTRMLFLFVAQGYGVVKPMLPNPKFVGSIGFLYALCELFSNGSKAHDEYKDIRMEDRGKWNSLPVYIVDFIILALTFSALVATIKVLWLRKANQSAKLKIYLWSLIGFFSFAFSLLVYVILDMCESVEQTPGSSWVAKAWEFEWVKVPILRLGFLAAIVQMATLWRPTENNMRYSYIPPVDSENADVDDEWAMKNENIKMKSGIYGNIARRRNHKKKQRPMVASNKKIKLEEDDDASDTLKWIEENVPDANNEVTVAAFMLNDEDIDEMKAEIAHLD